MVIGGREIIRSYSSVRFVCNCFSSLPAYGSFRKSAINAQPHLNLGGVFLPMSMIMTVLLEPSPKGGFEVSFDNEIQVIN